MGLRNKSWAMGMAGAALAFNMAAAVPSFAQQAGTPVTEAAGQNTAQSENDAPRITSSRSVEWDNPHAPVGMIAGLGILYGAFCLMAARRRMKGSWLRVGAGGVVALALLNPEIVEEEREHLPTEVLIVVDKSASQELGGRDSTTQTIYDSVIRDLGGLEGVRIRTVEAGGPGDAASDGTELFGALNTGLADVPRDRLGAVIILTDGQVHDIPEGSGPLGEGAPLHALVSGRADERDRRIVIDEAPQFGLVDERQTIRFRVLDDGSAGAAGPVRVTATSEGRELASRLVMPGQAAEVSLQIPHAGPNIVELKVEGLDGELTDVNNRVVASIEGIREKLSVLLISDINRNTRVFREILKSDPDVDLIHFTKMRTDEDVDYTPLSELSLITFPAREVFEEKIELFDLIIFDTYSHNGFVPAHHLDNISRFVQEGGALLVLAGPEYAGPGSLFRSPLSSVLPVAPTGQVTEAPYLPSVTDRGARHPVTRNLDAAGGTEEAPWGRWLSLTDADARAGDVVMAGAAGKPLLVLNREGEGRVAMIMSDNVWLWSKNHEGGGPYADLLRRTSHWLMQHPALEEESLRMTSQDGTVIIEQQTMSDVGSPITVRTPSGKTVTVQPEEAAPGIWRATVPAEEQGLYSAERGGATATTAFLNVGPPNPREFVNTLSTTALLEPLAESTGGKVARMLDENGAPAIPEIVAREDGQDNGDQMGIRMTEASIIRGVERDPVLPPAGAMILVIGAMAFAYFREGDRKRNQAAGPRLEGPSV